MSSAPKNVLVTGGAGFIGSALVRALIASTPHRVLNLDKLTYAASLDAVASVARNERYGWRQVDICDAGAVADAIAAFQPDAIVHLAAESHVDRSIEGPAEFVRTNVLGTGVLLEQALAYFRHAPARVAHAFRFVHVSSDEVYGDRSSALAAADEQAPYRPSSPYSATKAGADHLVRAWHRTYGLPVIVTHCSNNYGPFQSPEKFVARLIWNALRGNPLPVYGDGQQTRDWLHVDDHVAALVAVLERGTVGGTYNIASGSEIRNIELAYRVCSALAATTPIADRDYRALIELVEDRPGHDRRYCIDSARIRGELGWRPLTTLDDGLRRTVDWYVRNQEWCRAAADRAGRHRNG